MLSQSQSTSAQNPSGVLHGRAADGLAILLLLVGFAIRLFRLGAESLWYDETVSVYLASQPLAELVAHTARDIHPPAYYLLLHLWRFIANPTVAFGLEFLYGWPSLFFSLLVMVLTYAVARRAFGSNAALCALAFAAFQPTQIWFAQEVRMYALGAFALILTLWATLPLLVDPKQKQSPQTNPVLNNILYVFAALLGLYTLYYFLFWLAVLNLAIIVRLWKQGQRLRTWLLLQLLVLLGWLPWLPIFFRQATNPPVPPWRLPWQSLTEFISAQNEALAALWVGHIAPLTIQWPWAVIVVASAVAFYVYTKSASRSTRILWLVLCIGPLALLLLVSVIGAPIYHVRYISTYAPLFAIVLGALLASVPRISALLLATLFAFISLSSLFQLWTNPLYAADDHRGAVSTLAAEWRPGDSILVNAGWVYTALSVYWPTELPNPASTRPPAVADIVRLDTLLIDSPPISATAPNIFRTGSVDGDSNLGWSLHESDFFAISQEDTTDAMVQLAANHTRIWHYRLYDTVNDPTGHIRQWLANNTTLEFSQPIAGRDFLLLERYRTQKTASASNEATKVDFPNVGVTLLDSSHVSTTYAGEMLYVNLLWDAIESSVAATPPAISLRLYDAQGQVIVQSDTPATLDSTRSMSQVLALPIPADTIPGQYKVAILLYAPDTLLPYPAIAADGIALPSPIPLGEVTIELPQLIPHTGTPLATFDYINLLWAELPATPLSPGTTLAAALTWQLQPNDYQDQYIAHLELSNGGSTSIILGDFNLGDDTYLSSIWPALYPVRQHITMPLPEGIAPGIYQLRLSLSRASDGELIPARQPWRFGRQPDFTIGELEIAATVQE